MYATKHEFEGSIDLICAGRVQGWVWNKSDPEQKLTVVIRDDAAVLCELKASRFRSDLKVAGIGDGRYSFDVTLNRDLSEATAEVKGSSYRIPIQPDARKVPYYLNPGNLPDVQLNIENFSSSIAKPPSRFHFIRFDPNWDCNLHCVYCHNPRSEKTIDIEQFRKFIGNNVISTENFQIGCSMEPTLDPRLTDFMLTIADSQAKPTLAFQLQTNGILLHKHDYKKINSSGLTALMVSLDAAEPETQRFLRSGTSLKKVIRNIVSFRDACPNVAIQFITTVTVANIDKLDQLIESGLKIGVRDFTFREVFYYPNNNVVDHEKMPALVLKEGSFEQARRLLVQNFAKDANLVFCDAEFLEPSSIGLTVVDDR
jgi:Radical SAM superfamily